MSPGDRADHRAPEGGPPYVTLAPQRIRRRCVAVSCVLQQPLAAEGDRQEEPRPFVVYVAGKWFCGRV